MATADITPIFGGMITINSYGDGASRSSRAAAINAAKRVYEREHGIRLTLRNKRYTESFDPQRSEFDYTLEMI